jgi:hypothetical protein
MIFIPEKTHGNRSISSAPTNKINFHWKNDEKSKAVACTSIYIPSAAGGSARLVSFCKSPA